MSVTSTDSVPTGLERVDRSSKVRTTGRIISVLVTAFLVFDAAGKLAGLAPVKEGTPIRTIAPRPA